MKKLILSTLFLFVSCSQNPIRNIASEPFPLKAETKSKPWSGYWWSMLRGELVMGWNDGDGRRIFTENEIRTFDQCLSSYTKSCTDFFSKFTKNKGKDFSPLMKFDYFVRMENEKLYGKGKAPIGEYTHAAKWELENHFIGDNENHRYWDFRGFSGKCIGWALANFDFSEPTIEKEIGGIVFKPADIKGYLASIYNGAQFFIPEDQVMGNEYRDFEGQNTKEAREDVYPHDLLKALAQTIAKGKMLEADLDPEEGVWNYPIYKYEVSFLSTPDKHKVKGSVKLFYANDEVGIDEVFSTNSKRPDIKNRKLDFELIVPDKFDGDIEKVTSSRWTGEGIHRHPDAVILGIEDGWRQSIYEYKNTQMKEEVNFPLIKRTKVGNKWVPIIDELLKEYYKDLK
jgi:hypothetical protein